MSDDSPSLLPVALLLGGGVTLALVAWGFSSIGSDSESNEQMVSRLVKQSLERRGPGYAEWDAYASVDANWVRNVQLREDGRIYRWSPNGYWELLDVDEEFEPETQRFAPRNRYA